MGPRRRAFAGTAAALALVGGVARAERADEDRWVLPPAIALPPYDPAAARALYEDRCELCHGARGDGGGPVARDLSPRPRDFTRGVYKIRSTPSGALPTEKDVFDTLTRGMPGTSMPAWSGLSADDRFQLARYVLSFSVRYRGGERPEQALAIGAAPAPSPERIARGAEVWRKMKCARCHGEDGRGSGPASTEMRDDLGERSYPFNLTRGKDLRGGGAPGDVFRAFLTGLDGTPMPSYADSLGREEAWDLVLYVRSLEGDPSP